MGLYNFQTRFCPMILAGTKTHTIRAVRAHPDKPGNTMHLYTGLRTKKAKLLMRVPCIKIEDIEIWSNIEEIDLTGFTVDVGVKIDGILLDESEAHAFARRDGFSDFYDMLKFWLTPKSRLPFKGHIIYWEPPKNGLRQRS
jgi:hypothetical protein